MKNRLAALRERIMNSGFYKRAPRPVKWIIGSVFNNLGYKLLSLVLAIMLWSYVISTNTSITRTKTLYNLAGYPSGQSALSDRKLALTEDPTSALSGISVTVEAPQADYSRVSADNVQVLLDLSSVRSAGTQEVPLRATSSYGRVRSISPESLTLKFETLDSRNVSVNCSTTGEASGYWYNVTRTNPSMLTVSGAASVVQSITSARVTVDVNDMSSSTITALPYMLVDAAGNEISQAMLNCSTSSISVSMDIYPCREIPVSTDYSSVVTGTPAPGYILQSVTIQPESIMVAAEQELLDGLTELKIEPVSIEGASHGLSVKAAVSQLSDFKNVSTEQVYVNVNIVEESISSYLENIKVMFTGKAESLVASYEPVGLFVTGARSAVQALQESGITVNVDLTGLEAGSYQLSPTVDEQLYPDLIFQFEPVSVTLTGTNAGETSQQ